MLADEDARQSPQPERKDALMFPALELLSPSASFHESFREQVRQFAQQLLARHDLHDWSFAFNRRKRSMGMCFYECCTIELSLYFIERNSLEEIRETLLHEIAHALVGPGHGHDAVWKRKCQEIGARPIRCGHANMPEGRWQARCGNCQQRFDRHRKPKWLQGWFCLRCGEELGKLIWKKCAV
jgi:predicted SprT family Zn-dependent metalloprotease